MQSVRNEPTTHTILKVCLAVIIMWLLTRLWPILLVLISALVLAGTISSLVTRVERRGMSRGWAVGIVFLSLSVIVIVLGLLTVPALVRELIELMQNAPQIQARFAAARNLSTNLRRPSSKFTVALPPSPAASWVG